MALYESIKVKLHETLQRNKTPTVRLKSDTAVSLKTDMDELERLIVERIGRLRSAANEAEAVAVVAGQEAEHLIGSLNGIVADLQAKLDRMEETLRSESSSRRQLEESLTGKIHELESDVQTKDEVLVSRDHEIGDLKSELDRRVKQVAELETALEKAKEEVGSHAKRAEHLAVSARTTNAVLESQLNEQEELVRQKDLAITELEQKINVQVQDFETRIKEKDGLLVTRNAVISELRAQLILLTKGIGQVSSFVRQAEALANMNGEGETTERLVLAEASPENEKKIAPPEFTAPVPPSLGQNGAHEVVPAETFQTITSEFAEASGVMAVLASIIVGQHVTSLGESRESFPKTRIPELLERLSLELPNETQQSDFRRRLEKLGT
jgi:chromosome segregation ATPase